MSLLNPIVARRREETGRNSELETADQPAVRPTFKVTEKADGFGVMVFLPGVTKANLEITAEASQLKIRGRRTWKQPEGWTQIYRETVDAAFELILQHENSFDADKAEAEFRDGVLRLALPKADALKPKKIKIS
jgi:HSP20 family molecular chaperone IbpA